MKNLIIVPHRSAASGDVFRQNQLVALQFTDLALIGADDRCAFGFHDAVQKLADLLFQRRRFQLERRPAFLRILGTLIPQIAEDGGGEVDQFTRGRERPDKSFKGILDLCPRNGFAVAGAAMLAAHIVGIAPALALGPSGGHRMMAIATGNKASQREIRVDVLAGRCAGLARQTILNKIEGFERDQRFVLALA